MRRILPVLFGCVLLAIPALAQRGGHGGGGGGMRGGGSGGFHGSVAGGGFRGSGGFSRAGGIRGGVGYRGGIRGNYGVRYGYRGYGGLYYPGFYGGFYDPFWWNSGYYGLDSGYGYQDSGSYYAPDSSGYGSSGPSVVVISNEAPPPPVIVQQPPPPSSSAWSAGPQTQPQSQNQKYEDQLFLVAMHDGTIRAVLAYWVDGTTVHYVTMDHEQKQAPLTSIDRNLSERLNRERNVTFRLPG